MLLEFPQNLTEKELSQIRDVVHGHCGINLHEGKKSLIAARLAKRMRATGVASASDYLQQVLNDQGGLEFTNLIDALSTNLTEFFREPGHFQFLAETLLPKLLSRKSHDRRIRAWSAGCSSGQEPYSLAMTLMDQLNPAQAWDTKILATDISTRMLSIARKGVYPEEQVKGIPLAARQKYLTPGSLEHQPVFQVSDALRSRVCFRHLNLMSHWPFTGGFDFIFCRNVMIYFDKPTQQKLIDRFWDCLGSGGVLFTGHSESLTGISHRFTYVQPTIYAKA